MGTATSSAFPQKFPLLFLFPCPEGSLFCFWLHLASFGFCFLGSKWLKIRIFSGFLVAKFLQLFLKYHQISLFWAIVCR
jgi:hypothetical protein